MEIENDEDYGECDSGPEDIEVHKEDQVLAEEEETEVKPKSYALFISEILTDNLQPLHNHLSKKAMTAKSAPHLEVAIARIATAMTELNASARRDEL